MDSCACSAIRESQLCRVIKDLFTWVTWAYRISSSWQQQGSILLFSIRITHHQATKRCLITRETCDDPS